jgi:hypothetical protein
MDLVKTMEPSIKEIPAAAPVDDDTMVIVDQLGIYRKNIKASYKCNVSASVFGFWPGKWRNLIRWRTSRQVEILIGDTHLFASYWFL